MAIWRMPDGSEWDIPDGDVPQRPKLRMAGTWCTMTQPDGEHLYIQESEAPASLAAPPAFRDFLRQIGSRGGQSRAARHNRKQLALWGRVRRGKTPASETSAPAPSAEQGRVANQSPLVLNSVQFRQHLLQQAIPPSRNEYLKGIGRKGGLNRAARHSSEQRRAWARLGGLAKAAKNKRSAVAGTDVPTT